MKNLIIIFLTLFASQSFAQKVCGFSQKDFYLTTCMIGYTDYTIAKSNQKAIDDILNIIGIPNANFETKGCSNIENASALYNKQNGKRYIILDEEFLNGLNPNNPHWTSVFIVAHEIAHHLNGHTTEIATHTNNAKNREQELDCDRFAGFAIRKLGGTIQDIEGALNGLPHPQDNYSTHPMYKDRLNAAISGYNMAQNEEILLIRKYEAELEDYFNKKRYLTNLRNARMYLPFNIIGCNTKQCKEDLKKSFQYYFKVVAEEPNDASIYGEIASIYYVTGDYHNAEIYANKAYNISKNPEYILYAYTNCVESLVGRDVVPNEECGRYVNVLNNIDYQELQRGTSLKELAVFYGYQENYEKGETILKYLLQEKKDVNYWRPNFISDVYNDLSVFQSRQKKFRDAYDNIKKSLDLYKRDSLNKIDNKNYLIVLRQKAILENDLKYYKESLKTYNDFIVNKGELRPYDYYRLGDNYYKIGDFDNALKLSNMAIQSMRSREYLADAYHLRGVIKLRKEDVSGACADWAVAIDKGNEKARKEYKRYCQESK